MASCLPCSENKAHTAQCSRIKRPGFDTKHISLSQYNGLTFLSLSFSLDTHGFYILLAFVSEHGIPFTGTWRQCEREALSILPYLGIRNKGKKVFVYQLNVRLCGWFFFFYNWHTCPRQKILSLFMMFPTYGTSLCYLE